MGPDPMATQDPSQAPVGQMQQQLQQIAQTPMQPVPQAGPDQGSPVKRFLTNFFYGVGQGALSSAGLPTDYQKQQQTIANNQRQQQLNQQAGETSSLIGLHQQQLANEKQTYAQNEYENQQVPIPGEVAQHFPGQTTGRRRDINAMLQTGSLLNQRMPVNVDDDLAGVVGLPQGSQVDPRMLPILGRMAALKGQGWTVKDAGGILQRANKYTGELQPLLDQNGRTVTSNSVLTPQLRAYWNAKYGVSNVMDSAGNPTAISRLDQLNSGAPTMTEKASMNLASDKTGIGQFLNNNDFFRSHMNVLDDMTQRGLIARATREAEGNPGAAQSIVNGYLQQGMTPEAAEFASRLLNQREMSGVLRKYTGNGGSTTDALRAIVNSNLPGAARSTSLNNALLDRDQQLANSVLQNLARPSAYAPKARGSSAPPLQSGQTAPEGTRVKMQDGSFQVKRDGKWVSE